MNRSTTECRWADLFSIFFYQQIGFNIAPKEDTTLNEMLVLGLDKFVEDLTEISGRAAKEFSLEKVCMVYSFKLILVLQLRIQSGCIMVDTFFQKFGLLTSMRLGGKVFFEYNKLIILSPIHSVVSTIHESLQLW